MVVVLSVASLSTCSSGNGDQTAMDTGGAADAGERDRCLGAGGK